MPPAFMNSPASMKKGTASSGKLLAPSHMFWMTICGSVMPMKYIMHKPHPIRAKATGMPSAISASKEVMKMKTVMPWFLRG